jgi:hypothetical protein
MDHLPASKAQGHLDLVALLHESLDLFGLEVDIVDAGLRPQPDLLHKHGLLVLARFPVLLLLLVLEPAIVHEPADRRHGGRRYFDQIEAPFTCDAQRFVGGEHAKLAALLVDQSNLADANVLIDSKVFADGSLLDPFGIFASRAPKSGPVF